MTVHQVHFVSPSGGHRGFSTYATLQEALNERRRLRANGYRAWLGTERRA